MTPLCDQDGRQRDEQAFVIPRGVLVTQVLVRHDCVVFSGTDGVPVMLVDRPTHPGAGLALEVSDSVDLAPARAPAATDGGS